MIRREFLRIAAGLATFGAAGIKAGSASREFYTGGYVPRTGLAKIHTCSHADRMAAYKRFQQGGFFTVNNIRALEGLPPEQATWHASRRLTEAEICKIFGIPRKYLGALETGPKLPAAFFGQPKIPRT